VWVHADSALVERLLGNLLGNAVAHAPKGAAVTIGLAANGDVTVSNPAPHLTHEDLVKLGEQFFRVSAVGHGAHAGLGLPLAKAIAKVLGLALDFELLDDGNLVASVRGFRGLGESLRHVDGVP
jgi:signal transduction histidine kinase